MTFDLYIEPTVLAVLPYFGLNLDEDGTFCIELAFLCVTLCISFRSRS